MSIYRRRSQISCPVCESRCVVSASELVSRTTRVAVVSCTNHACNWSGLVAIETIRTISPPSKFYDASKAPPLIQSSDNFDNVIKKFSKQTG